MRVQNNALRGFLARVLRNRAGNTLAIVAAAMIPLAALIGGGVDMSRIYLVRARLQQACDAGALSGRQMMAGGQWSTNSYAARTTANNMFSTNFADGAYGTTSLAKAYTEAGGKVTGNASVDIAMTVMRIFGERTRSIAVTCDAEMRLPNTDVMFVLDTTGSMNCVAGNTSCSNNGNVPAIGSKIDGLKVAVQCFYEALAKINTPAVCSTPDNPPSGGISSQVQLRFGFVPYSVNVNVGKLLPNDFLANAWNYQTRVPVWTPEYYVESYGTESSKTYGSTSSSTSNGSWTALTSNVTVSGTTYQYRYTGVTSSACNNYADPPTTTTGTGSATETQTAQETPTYPQSSRTTTYSKSQTNVQREYAYSWTRSSSWSTTGTCTLYYRDNNVTYTTPATTSQPVNWATRQVFSGWTYQQASLNVSGLKAGESNWNSSVSLPVGASGTNTSVAWDGCIEERQTYRTDTPATTYASSIPDTALDLNINMAPVTSDATTQWGPLLRRAVWPRFTTGGSNTRNNISIGTGSDYLNSNRDSYYSYYCPTASRKLQSYTTDTDGFVSYVNSLTAIGNTYHDIGLLWGARLMSPTGIFGGENALTPQGGMIERHMIFMTDGDTQTANSNMTAYGLGYWDGRQNLASTTPSASQLDAQVNARFSAICEAVKNMNITLWVVNYGAGTDSTTDTRLTACATPGRYYSAASSAALLTTFQNIAAQISALRLTK